MQTIYVYEWSLVRPSDLLGTAFMNGRRHDLPCIHIPPRPSLKQLAYFQVLNLKQKFHKFNIEKQKKIQEYDPTIKLFCLHIKHETKFSILLFFPKINNNQKYISSSYKRKRMCVCLLVCTE